MDIAKIPAGRAPPDDINVIVEIPEGGRPIKYELDKESGALIVDRFLNTAMYYPGNYGFVPHTLAEDGDPVDVLIIGTAPVVPGAVVRCRPIGALIMQDEKGPDDLHPYSVEVRSHRDLPPALRSQIAHFFSHYKDLEAGKWVKIADWVDVEEAAALIMAAIARASG
jgi:inorganic pyrophosphatase